MLRGEAGTRKQALAAMMRGGSKLGQRLTDSKSAQLVLLGCLGQDLGVWPQAVN